MTKIRGESIIARAQRILLLAALIQRKSEKERLTTARVREEMRLHYAHRLSSPESQHATS